MIIYIYLCIESKEVSGYLIRRGKKTAQTRKDLPSSGTAEKYCWECHPLGCLWSDRQYPPSFPWRCSSAASPCHVVSARSSHHLLLTSHSLSRCFQTDRHDRHWQAAPRWLTGIHSAGFSWTYFPICVEKGRDVLEGKIMSNNLYRTIFEAVTLKTGIKTCVYDLETCEVMECYPGKYCYIKSRKHELPIYSIVQNVRTIRIHESRSSLNWHPVRIKTMLI